MGAPVQITKAKLSTCPELVMLYELYSNILVNPIIGTLRPT